RARAARFSLVRAPSDGAAGTDDRESQSRSAASGVPGGGARASRRRALYARGSCSRGRRRAGASDRAGPRAGAELLRPQRSAELRAHRRPFGLSLAGLFRPSRRSRVQGLPLEQVPPAGRRVAPGIRLGGGRADGARRAAGGDLAAQRSAAALEAEESLPLIICE